MKAEGPAGEGSEPCRREDERGQSTGQSTNLDNPKKRTTCWRYGPQYLLSILGIQKDARLVALPPSHGRRL
jgi:hypothetical protein